MLTILMIVKEKLPGEQPCRITLNILTDLKRQTLQMVMWEGVSKHRSSLRYRGS